MERKLITIIDDDEAVRDSVAALLGAAGMEVEAFGSAEDFFAAPASERAQCVLMDVHLPGISGLDALERLRAARRSVPVIVISGGAGLAMNARAAKAGALALLRKPVPEETLLGAIASAFTRSRAGEAAAGL